MKVWSRLRVRVWIRCRARGEIRLNVRGRASGGDAVCGRVQVRVQISISASGTAKVIVSLQCSSSADADWFCNANHPLMRSGIADWYLRTGTADLYCGLVLQTCTADLYCGLVLQTCTADLYCGLVLRTCLPPHTWRPRSHSRPHRGASPAWMQTWHSGIAPP